MRNQLIYFFNVYKQLFYVFYQSSVTYEAIALQRGDPQIKFHGRFLSYCDMHIIGFIIINRFQNLFMIKEI